MQTVGAVVPDTVIHQAAAGIAAFIGARAALENALVRNDQLERIIPQDRGVARGCSIPPDPQLSPLTFPSVHGEYRFPSDAQDGYHVSAPVYSACRPVNASPVSIFEGLNGQSAGGSDSHRPAVL